MSFLIGPVIALASGAVCHIFFFSSSDAWYFAYVFGIGTIVITHALLSNPLMLYIFIFVLGIIGARGDRGAFIFMAAAIIYNIVLVVTRVRSNKLEPAPPSPNGTNDDSQS